MVKQVENLRYGDLRGLDVEVADVERVLGDEVAAGLDQVFTFWAARPPRTPFLGVRALEPGCWARWREGMFLR